MPNITEEKVERIVKAVAKKFRSFGNGQATADNPVAEAFKSKPAMFALGVDIEEVVRFVLKEAAR